MKMTDDEAMILLRATNIIRHDILSTCVKFDGTFHTGCQQNSVPNSLKTFIGMVLGGPNITMQCSNMIEAQTTLTLAQLVIVHMIKCRSKGTTSSYHSTDHEPPLPIYLGLMLHAKTRKRDLIDKQYGLGLSVSCDRVLALSTEMGNKACAQFESDGVVCPIRLRKAVFTTAAVDNIDHNPSSTTAHRSFHGTGISLFQHPTPRSPGEER